MDMLALSVTALERLESSSLWLVFSFVCLIYAVMSLILVYHWHKYGIEGDGVLHAVRIFYFIFTIALLGIAGSTLLFWSFGS